MKNSVLSLFVCLLYITSFSQVQIDKAINLNGSGANAKVTGIKHVSDTTDAVNVGVLQKGKFVYATSVSGANDIVLSFSPAFSTATLAAGTILNFKAAGANTGNVRLNVDGLGLTPLFKDVSSNLAANDIKLNQMVQVVFDGTNFQMLSRTPDAGGTVTQITATAPLTGGIINSSGTIGINQANASTNGYLSSTDWNTFNSKLASEVDGSITNEGALTVQAGASTTSIISSNTSGSTNVTLSAGTGVGLGESGNTITITNSAPDQTVSISNAGNITVGGSYPSFTLATNGGTLSGGTTNYVPKWTSATALSSTSLIYDNGTNVGIGTSSPGAQLDIGGNPTNAIRTAYFTISGSNTGSSDRPYIRGTATHLVVNGYATASGGTLYLNYPGDLAASQTTTTRIQETMFFSATGSGGGANVGIGTSSPAYKLDVSGDINFSNTIKYGGVNTIYGNNNDIYANIRVIQNNGYADGMYVNYNSSGGTAADLRFYANGTTERMRVSASSGHVGIGNSNPGYRLTVSGGAIGGNYGLLPNYAGWSSWGTGDGGAAIYNDNGSYKKLMVVGNNSAGGAREVGLWDNVTIAARLTVATCRICLYWRDNDGALSGAQKRCTSMTPGSVSSHMDFSGDMDENDRMWIGFECD